MILATVMTEINTALDTISGLRCFPFPADNVAAPASIVGYPTEVTYDVTMGRGVDSFVIPVFLLVARITDRTARDALGAYLDGSGAKSVKAVLQAGTYSNGTKVRVASADIQVVTVADIDYLAAVFSVNVYGQGA